MRSYRPEELFDDARRAHRGAGGAAADGRPADERQPARQRRAAAARPRPARLPRLRRRGATPGRRRRARRRGSSATFLRDVIARQPDDASGLFGPDETASNRLDAVFEVTDRAWTAEILAGDDHLAPDGRVMEVLSEHLCQGWLEGYLLTGRHGLFTCYEAFIHIVDSMFNQHAKWLKVTRDIPWRRPIASLNYLLTLARLAPGPQRLLPPGSRVHRPRRQQEGRGRPGLPAAGRQHAAVGRRPLPAQPRLRQRHRRRQAAALELAVDGRGDPPLHRAASASGTGRATTRAASRTSCWPAPATSRRSRRSPRSTSSASTCRTSRSGSSTSST